MLHNQNLIEEFDNFVTHLECGLSGEILPANKLQNLSSVGKPLLVRYDLGAIAKQIDRDILQTRPPDIWRYREFLPIHVSKNIVSLGEAITPLINLKGLGSNLWVKDESRMPTGSFKARGLCLAVSKAKELGVRSMAIPTNGNAGAALAAYCKAAGIEAYVFCPNDTPEINIREIVLQGANVFKINGLINECGRFVAEGSAKLGWFDTSTLKEPYRIEGKKTMGLELAEQFNWTLPDNIFYPTGGGTGLIAMWKAFQELEKIGWIDNKKPKMIAVQAAGCAPIVKAYEEDSDTAELWENAFTVAAGIRVPAAIGDFLILDAVRKSGGFAIAVTDNEILSARDEVAKATGVLLCPEAAATFAAWKTSTMEAKVDKNETSVLFNCATGLKYPMPMGGRDLDKNQPFDFDSL